MAKHLFSVVVAAFLWSAFYFSYGQIFTAEERPAAPLAQAQIPPPQPPRESSRPFQSTITRIRERAPLSIQVSVSTSAVSPAITDAILNLQTQIDALKTNNSSLFTVVAQSSPTSEAILGDITDAEVPDTITVSNYLHLSGGNITGTLGVGTSTRWGNLSVEHSDSGDEFLPAFVVADEGTSTPSLIVLNQNGNVGIGTSSPMEKLTLSGGGFFNPITTAPNIIGGADQGNETYPQFVVVHGKYAFVTHEASAHTCDSTNPQGCELKIYDISTASTTFIGGADTSTDGGTNAGGLAVVWPYAYVTTQVDAGTCSEDTVAGCELQIWDISNPSSPRPVGGYNTADTTDVITVSGRYAFLGKNRNPSCSTTNFDPCTVEVIDISDPFSPAAVAGWEIGNVTVYDIFVSGRYAYIMTTADVDKNEFSIWDISNIASTTEVGGVNLGIAGAEVEVVGRYAYLLMDDDAGAGTCSGTTLTGCEFRIYDISNPASPSPVAGLDLDQGSYGYTSPELFISGRYAYIAQVQNSATCNVDTIPSGCEFLIADISNPTSPELVSGVDFPDLSASGVFVSGKQAVAAKDPSTGACSSSATGGCELVLFNIPGSEIGTAVIGSLEVGNLQLKHDLIAQANIQVDNSLSVGEGGIFSTGGLAVSSTSVFMDETGFGTSVPGALVAIENTSEGDNPNRIPLLISRAEGGTPFIVANEGEGSGARFVVSAEKFNDAGGTEIAFFNSSGDRTVFLAGGHTSFFNSPDGYPGGVILGVGWTSPSNTMLGVAGTTTMAGLEIFASQLAIGNGKVATTSLFGQYGKFGFGTATPFAQVAIESVQGVTGSNTPIFVIGDQGTTSPLFYVSGVDGNIGIGTDTPAAVLAIESTKTVPALMINAGGTGEGNVAISVEADDVCVDGSADAACSLNDLAEIFPASEPLEAGDIAMLDPAKPEHLKKASGSGKLAGVISTSPAIVFEGNGIKALGGIYNRSEGEAPLALSGRVPVKINLEGGSINIGDPITLSSTAGVGKKATESGWIVGWALESYDSSSGAGSDKIVILADTAYWRIIEEDSGAVQSADAGFLAQVIDTVTNKIKEWFNSTILFIKELAVEKFKIGTPEKPAGITIYDKKSGQPYCLEISDGQVASVAGECGSEAIPEFVETTTESVAGEEQDTTAPTITLIGNAILEIEIGSLYSDPGASISDNVNQNLGYKITVATTTESQSPEMYPHELVLDTSAPAEYTITYIAVDQAGNRSETRRTVTVKAQSAETQSANETPSAETENENSEPAAEPAETSTSTEPAVEQ